MTFHRVGKPDPVHALQVLRKANLLRKNQIAHTQAERSILQAVNHPFIMTMHYAFQTSDKLYIVTDFCQGGELFFCEWRGRRRRLLLSGMPALKPAQIAVDVTCVDWCSHPLLAGLKKVKVFSQAHMRFYAAELVLALEHLHAMDVAYRCVMPRRCSLLFVPSPQCVRLAIAADRCSMPRTSPARPPSAAT